MIEPQSLRDHRACAGLGKWGAVYRDMWQSVDQLRVAQHTEWPSYVFMPLEAAGTIMMQSLLARGERPKRPGDLVRPASMLTLFSAWRLTKGIYRYDPVLYDAVVKTSPDGDIPAELLRRLPQWCVYLETPEMTAPLVTGGQARLHGVWAWLDRRRNEGLDILTLGLDTDGYPSLGHVPLVGTLEQSLAKVEADWRAAAERGNTAGPPPQSFAGAARQTFAPILSLLLYLCSDVSEIGDGTHRPTNPQPKRTRDGWRFTPADRPTTWNVGVRIGAAVRRAYQEMEQNLPPIDGRARPQGRCGYWQTFLADPESSERSVKWLPPDPDQH